MTKAIPKSASLAKHFKAGLRSSQHYQAVFISGKKIISINDGDNYPNDFIPDLTLDAKNKIISRGFVDCSVKFRELIKNSNTDLEQELNAVAAGGVTNFVCQPDINFPIDKPGLVKMLIVFLSIIKNPLSNYKKRLKI